ncbi:Zinc knuckle family protein [Aphelenchoides avenae]|nr:Zinc knuckle family protein [Aphelenchus avenae]
MDYDNIPDYDSSIFLDPSNYTSQILEGIPSEYSIDYDIESPEYAYDLLCAANDHYDDAPPSAVDEGVKGIPFGSSLGHGYTAPADAAMRYAPEDDLEGSASEFSCGHISNAPTEPPSDADSLYAPEGLEGTPSEFSTGHISDAPTEPSTDEDSPCAPEDDSEGTPSEFSTGHISNAPTEPSSDDESLSVTENDSEGSPSKSSIGHYSNAPTEPSTDDESTSSSSASGPTSKHQPAPQSRKDYGHHLSLVRRSFAAYAAALRTSNRPERIPSGSVHISLPPSNEQKGIPSCSEPRPSAPTPRPAETDPPSDYEQQLARLLTLLAKRKRDVVIDIPAAPYVTQYRQIRAQVGVSNTAHEEALQLLNEVLAARDAWVTHIDVREARDCATGADARRSFDRFSTEYGLVANLERGKQLEAMLRSVSEEVCKHWKRIKDFPGILECLCRGKPLPEDLLKPFTIVGTMPPVKFYKSPGIPGSSTLPGRRSDKERHGIPCHPKSEPTPGSDSIPMSKPTPASDFVSTQHSDRRRLTKPLSSQNDQRASPVARRPYCVFCSCHDHWSSDCPTSDFGARWAFVNESLLCQQCLRAGHRLSDCRHYKRPCLHCGQRHHAALCPEPRQRFLPSTDIPMKPGPGQPSVAVATEGRSPLAPVADPSLNPVMGYPSLAIAGGGRSPLGRSTTAPSAERHRAPDGRNTTTNPLDTAPPPSSTQQPSAATADHAPEHCLATAITSYFQRNSAGSGVVVGFYARSQDDAGRTFYRILKPLNTSQSPRPANDLHAHLKVDRVFMVETTVRLLPHDPLLSTSATPDEDGRSPRRFAHSSAGSSFDVYPSSEAVAVTDLSGVTPRQATVVSHLTTATETSSTQSAPDPALFQLIAEHHTQSKLQHVLAAQHHATELDSAGQNPTAAATVASAGNPADKTGTPLATSLASNRILTPQRPPRAFGDDTPNNEAPDAPSLPPGGPSSVQEHSMGKRRKSPDAVFAEQEENGTPLLPLGPNDDNGALLPTPPTQAPPASERQLPLRRVRRWTASRRKKLSPPSTTVATPHTAEAQQPAAGDRLTTASRSLAPGSCQEQGREYARAYVRSPCSSAATPVLVMLDLSERYTTCSTKLALDLRLPLSSIRRDVHASRLPDLVSVITITACLNGRPAIAVPVTITPTPIRLQHDTMIWVRPEIVIGRDSQHLFRTILTSSKAPLTVQPPHGSNGTPFEPSGPHCAPVASSVPNVVVANTADRADFSNNQYADTMQRSDPDAPVTQPQRVLLVAQDAGTSSPPAKAQDAGPLDTPVTPAPPQQPPSAQLNQEMPEAEDDPSAMDHEQSKPDASGAEGNPSVADIPLPAQEPPLTRASTADTSIEIIERDESPGVLSALSGSPAPVPSTDTVPLFQHLLAMQTIQPTLQPRNTQKALAVFYPQASPEFLDKLWADYQKLPLNFYGIQPPPTETVGTAVAVLQPKPAEAQFDTADEDAELDNAAHDTTMQSPDYTPLPSENASPHSHTELGMSPFDDLEARFDAPAPRAEGNSPQPMDEQDVQPAKTKPGFGHPSMAVATEGRSPLASSSSDTIRTRNPSTEHRRGTPRASSRGSTAPRAHHLPWLGEGRQGQDW